MPGAVVRQFPDFGAPEGPLGAEYFSLAAGTDMAPPLRGPARRVPCAALGLPDLRPGRGRLRRRRLRALRRRRPFYWFYWPFYWSAGHSVRVGSDAELIMFSPQVEHGEVIEHIRGKLATA